MLITVEEGRVERRRLILRDSLGILTLLLIVAALFAVTFFLFRSFSLHRAELGRRWSERGRAALAAGKPDEAITALRTALVYAPGTREYELPLAEALGQTGRPDQAEEGYQHFMSLWAAQPGYGPINLQLARLARKRGLAQDAVRFYRAAIYGIWEGDGVKQRAEARLELAQYLIEQHDLQSARLELMIAGGDAQDNFVRDMRIGGLLEQADDPNDAETYYRRALKVSGRNTAESRQARDAMGRLEAEQAATEAAAAAAVAQAAVREPAAKGAAGSSEKPKAGETSAPPRRAQ